MARSIVPIVEGHGEVESVPLLVRRVLQEELQRYDILPAKAINTKGKGTLMHRIKNFLSLAAGGDAVLVVFDADEHCALELVKEICDSCRGISASTPVAVVCAVRAYEAWLLASIETVFPGQATMSSKPETLPNPKSALRDIAPDGRYRETEHQVRLTSRIDIDIASANSRSFRRFCHAIKELVKAIDSSTAIVTPTIGKADAN